MCIQCHSALDALHRGSLCSRCWFKYVRSLFSDETLQEAKAELRVLMSGSCLMKRLYKKACGQNSVTNNKNIRHLTMFVVSGIMTYIKNVTINKERTMFHVDDRVKVVAHSECYDMHVGWTGKITERDGDLNTVVLEEDGRKSWLFDDEIKLLPSIEDAKRALK